MANTGDGELGNFALPAHIDHQWTPVPSSGSLLYALEVPSIGGETRFTNLARAYESLDEATRREIDGLRLINYNPFIRLREAATAAVSPPTARRTSNRSRAASTHWYAPTRKAAGAYCSSAPTPRWRFPATTRAGPGADRSPARTSGAPGTELQPRLVGGRHRLVGQPGRAACAQRLPGQRAAAPEAHQPGGQPSVLNRHPQRAPAPPLPTDAGRCAPLWRAPSVPANSRTATCCRSSAISPRLSCP